MPRIRYVKPEFWTSESVAELHPESRLTFIGLLTVAEDNGVGVANPRLLASQLYPLDDAADAVLRVERALSECADAGHVVLYEQGGKRLYYVTGWDDHQRVIRPSRCRYERPSAEAMTSANSAEAPPRQEPSPDTHASLNEPSMSPHTGEGGRGNGERGSGRGGTREAARPPALVPPPPRQRIKLPEELQAVVDSWADGSGSSPTRREIARITGDARGLLGGGTPLPDVVAGARQAGREGWPTIEVSVRKHQARSRPQPGPVDERIAGWQALKRRETPAHAPAGRGTVIDAEAAQIGGGGDR
jgi:hypothetical protein